MPRPTSSSWYLSDSNPVQSTAAPRSSAALWAAEASKASSLGAETSLEVEALCRDLVARCSSMEAEIETKRKEVHATTDQRSELQHQIATIDEKIALAREARLQALRKVQGFTRMSVNEVKAMKNRPPRIVRRAIEAIYMLLNCQRWRPGGPEGPGGLMDVEKEWSRIQRMLSNDGFVKSVLRFDVAFLDSAPNVALHLVEKYFTGILGEAELGNPSSRGGDAQHFEPKQDAASSLPPVGMMSSRGAVPAATGGRLAVAPNRWPASARSPVPTGPMEGLLPTPGATSSSTALAPAAATARPAMTAIATSASFASPGRRGASRDASTTPRFSRNSVADRSSTEALREEPLDVAAVSYASRACGAMATWASEVLHEFFALRQLRLLRQAAIQQMEALGVCSREGAIAQIQKELAMLLEELDSWRVRLTELRTREAEAERAKALLLQLSCLEDRSIHSPGLMRSARCTKLQPVLAPNAEARKPGTPGRGIRRKPKSRENAGTENACWPPRGRKYLHCMSSPKLPMAEEAIDRRDDLPLSPSLMTNQPVAETR